MKTFKVFKEKSGVTTLISFEKTMYSIELFAYGNNYMEFWLARILGKDNIDVFMKKMLGNREYDLENSHLAISAMSMLTEDYKMWVNKFIKAFSKYGSFHDPLWIDKSIDLRRSALNKTCAFSLKLNDHNGSDTKKEYRFNFEFQKTISALQAQQSEGVLFDVLALQSIPNKFNYITLEDGIKFCDKMETNHDYWNLNKQSTKPSKIVQQLFNIKAFSVFGETEHEDLLGRIISSTDFEKQKRKSKREFMRDYDSSSEFNLTYEQLNYYMDKGAARLWEIIAGQLLPREYDLKETTDIESIYGTPSAPSGIGTLGNSCMNKENRRSYTCANQSKFYNNLTGVSVMYAVEDEKLIGRALMWKALKQNKLTSEYTDEFTFVDRIYGSEDFIYSIRNWAKKKGYYWRKSQSAGSYELTNGNNNDDPVTHYKTLVSKLSFGKVNRKVPYFDTFKHFSVISKSKNYAKLQLSSIEVPGSEHSPGTGAQAIISRCSNCNIISVKSRQIYAHIESGDSELACEFCTNKWHNEYYFKNKKDVRLTFNSKGENIMPKIDQAGKLVTVEINGKKVLFDINDQKGIREFFEKKTKKARETNTIKTSIDWQ